MIDLTPNQWSIVIGVATLAIAYAVWRFSRPKFERLCGACRRSTDFRNSHCPNCTQRHAEVGFLYKADDRSPHFAIPDDAA
ncbi:MAG: hypothetical protein AAF532_05275 [Planctomycetota bacterium]